jgi:hypothetical protein
MPGSMPAPGSMNGWHLREIAFAIALQVADDGRVFCLTCVFHEVIFLTARSIIEYGIT